jgi:hypothetical protein
LSFFNPSREVVESRNPLTPAASLGAGAKVAKHLRKDRKDYFFNSFQASAAAPKTAALLSETPEGNIFTVPLNIG